MYSQPGIQKPTPKKGPGFIIACFACIVLVIGIGAGFFLMQKYNFQITKQGDDLSPRSDVAPDVIEPSTVDQPSVATFADNTDINIGDLFNQVNPAVATVITYDCKRRLRSVPKRPV